MSLLKCLLNSCFSLVCKWVFMLLLLLLWVLSVGNLPPFFRAGRNVEKHRFRTIWPFWKSIFDPFLEGASLRHPHIGEKRRSKKERVKSRVKTPLCSTCNFVTIYIYGSDMRPNIKKALNLCFIF
jgi:hypothetical protein